jgi:hypothetical protein
MGVMGNLQTWRRGKQHSDMQLDIERGAGLTVEESRTTGQRSSVGGAAPRMLFFCLRGERQRPNCSRINRGEI